MRRLTSVASDILRELQGPRAALRLVGGRIDVNLIDELAETGDPMAVPALVRLLIGADRVTADHLEAAISALMKWVTPRLLPDLDESFRALGRNDVVDWAGWRDMTPPDVRVLASSIRHGSQPLAVATFHRSGYVRHEAVERLDRIECQGELPFLLVRLNDWVLPVAEAARQAVLRRVDPRWASEWASCLALVSRIRATTRRSHEDIIDRAFSLLKGPDQRDALTAALRSSDTIARRLAYRLARDSQAIALSDVVRLALADADPIVRLEAVHEALPKLDDAALRTLLDTIDANSFMPVRRAGLLAATERFPDEAAARVERGLLDRNAAVRELARFHLTKRDPARSFSVVYSDELTRATKATQIVVALAGLGETGDRSSASLVEPFAHHERPLVRRTALRALARLAADTHGDLFLGALRDVSPRVVGEARAALRANPALIDADVIRNVLHDGTSPHGQTSALVLSHALGKWRCLLLLLEGSMLPEIDAATSARQLLRAWVINVNRSQVPPKRAELANIDDVLPRTRFSIDDSLRREIAATLDAWR